MPKDRLTATQQAILYKKDDHPEWTNQEIADAVGCSESHVSRTLNNYSIDDVDDPKKDDSGSSSLLFGLIGLLFKITWWCIAIPIKIGWAVFVELPLRIIFGPKDK